MNFKISDIFSNSKYSSLKHNVMTSYLLRNLTRSRARNLKSLIFTATTGRSGTKSLVRIFECIDGCVAYHEPHPAMMNNEKMINRPDFNDEYTSWVYENIKSVNIRRYAKKCIFYFESNHAFIKSFHDHVINDFGEKIKVIHVYRNPVEVANSIYSIGNIPGSRQGNMWWLNYKSPHNKINISYILENDENFKDDFYKCLWYWYEIEERIKYWRGKYKDIKFVDFKTENINSYRNIKYMLNELDVPFNEERIKSACKTRENLKKDEKIRQPINKHDALRMHDNFLNMLIKNGYDHIANSILYENINY